MMYNKGMLHNMQNQNGYRLWAVLILTLIVVTHNSYVSLSVTTSSLVIYQTASYQFIINRQFDPVNLVFTASPPAVPLNSLILIQFPSQFLTVSSTSTVACTNTNGVDLGCTLNSGTRTVTITKYYQTSSTLANPQIVITMPTIINAYKAGASNNFFWEITSSTGTVIDQGPAPSSNYLSTSLIFTPANFQTCTLSATDAYVTTYSPLTFQITPNNPIPTQGKLVIAIPNSWPSDPLAQSTFTTNPICTPLTGMGSSTLSCSYDSSQAQLTITGITSTIETAFSFTVTNIMTPPTVSSSETISIYSEWSDGTIINTCSSTVSGLKAAPFQTISLVSNDNTVVQSSFTAKLQVTLSRAFYYQDTIAMLLPNQFLGVSVSSPNFATMIPTPNLNTLTLSNFPSSPTTITTNNVLTFTLSSITNPPSTQPLALTLSFYRNNQIYQTSQVTYTATAGTLTSFSIAPDSNFVHTTGTATFTLVSALNFPTGSTISLTYPSTVSVADSAVAAVTRCSLNGTGRAGVTYQVTSNQIVFRNVFASDFKGTVVLEIPTFTNPPTAQPSIYSLAAYDSNAYSVLTSAYALTADTMALANNSVSADSLTVLASGVTLTLTLTTNYPFTAVSIQVPPEITVSPGFSSTCAPNTFSSCTLSGQNLTFLGTHAAGTYQLSWGYNTNPNSQEPTSSFTVTTYYQGWKVETSKGVLALTMTSRGAFLTIISTPSSKINSATISLSVSISAPAGTPSGTLTATLPSQLGLTSASAPNCTLVSPSFLCAWSAGTTSYTLVISSIVNSVSFEPLPSIAISLANSNNYGSLSSSVSGWSNEVASSFSTSVSGTNNYKGEANNFLFSMTGLPGGQNYARITINSAFPVIATAPSGTTKVSDHVLDVPCTASTCSANIALTDPTADGTFNFQLVTYTATNYQVATSTSNAWTYDCSNTYCRSCLANLSCIDCYSSAISPYSIFSTSTSSCVSACPTGFFLVSSTCTPCDANCSACSSTAKHCTACPANYFLDTTYFLCVPTCLSGYFANSLNQQCDSCTAPCLTCNLTATTCLSCNATTYLFGSECRTSCPTGTYVANPTTSKCDPCDSTCLTCSGTTATCTSCNTSIPLYLQVSKCVSVCSANYFLVNDVCTYCQAPCKTCTVSVTTCGSCFIDGAYPVYYSSACITAASCPVGHYLNSTNSSCEVCPAQCTQCSSSTSCSLCSTNYYLYEASCVSGCPNTSYPYTNSTSGYCLTCSPCATCSAANTCTSCTAATYLYQTTCYATCPNGTYPSSPACLACPADCPLCQNASYCLTCVNNLHLYLGTCYSICPNGTYSSGSVCASCPSTCATCTSSSSCQSCSTGYSLQNSQCVQTCSVGLSYNQVCYPCGLHCAICSNSSGTCSLCSTSYLLYDNTCISACPSTQVSLDGLTCSPCSATYVNCSTCSSTACLSCSYGQLVSGACKPCDPGYYQLSGACILCPVSCTACTSQTQCQVCAASYYLYGSICTSECPRNMVPNGTVCSYCGGQCSICNLANSLCSVCNAGVYLYDNACYSTCPAPLVVSYDFLSCVTQQVYYQQFSQDAKIVPFPFSIAAAVLIILGYILRCFHPRMHLQTALCAAVGLVELSCWGIFIAFELLYWNNYHETARMGFLCGCIGVALLYLLNAIHARLYCLYIAKDKQFTKWYRYHSCSNCVLLWLASMLSFKFYRLIHSKFLGKEALSLVLSSVNQLLPFSLLGVLSVLLCSAPVCVGCALALYNSVSKDQEFFIALDTLVVTGAMVVLILLDLRHTDDYFHDDHEAKNLKRKIYEEDSIKFERLSGNSDNSSAHVGPEEDPEAVEGALAETGQKFKSTFQHTKLLHQAPSQTKIKGEEEDSEFHLEESEGDQGLNPKGKWQPVKFDHHGYQLKYDSQNNPVRYDEHGYRVEIDEQGNHHRYNQLGQQVRMIDGKPHLFDQNGHELIDGRPHDDRGYEVRSENGETVFYDKWGFKVVGFPPDEKHVDENGYLIEVDEEGQIHRYQQDGFEVVDYKGEKAYRDREGHFMRKNEEGSWEMYDPEDGFTLKTNPETGRLQKFDEWGFRVEIDPMGTITRFDQDNNVVTILPGGVIIRHDPQGYRVEKDPEGKVHRYDQDGYQYITDEKGKPKLIDGNGYTVQKDLYGQVTLFDSEGFRVVIDHQTGKHARYNEEGLLVTVDEYGKRVLKDKRGKTVKELEGDTFQKYDQEGNKIFLDDNGYQVQYDPEGNLVLYDKVGDRVQTSYDIEESQQGSNFQHLLTRQSKPSRYKYKPSKVQDNEAELQKLMLASQPFTFEEEEELSELKEFHEELPPEIHPDKELQQLIDRERSNMEVSEGREELVDLEEFQFQEELDDIAEITPEGLAKYGAYTTSQILKLREGQQHEYDQQAIARELDENQPDILAIKKRQEKAAAETRKRDLNRILNTPKGQTPIQIKSVADANLEERSFQNQGVQPLENRTEMDELVDELEVPLGKGKGKRGNRSEAYLPNAKKTTQTVYNYNTVEVEIKNQNKLYDEEEEIESLHEDDWQEEPPVFASKEGTSNANTNILYLEDQEDNNDALTQLVQRSESKHQSRPEPRYHPRHDLLSGRSIQQIEQQLFGQAGQPIRERKQFKLSGGPNPLVEYAKAMQANRKSLQQKMYLDNYYKQ